ncbi:MAG: T9SS type A sorting domain-containing protein, partial [Bacteroidetes bacterium]|nr:T9SS type A sorting domain-containing protein [Bacteroidota bacterium]
PYGGAYKSIDGGQNWQALNHCCLCFTTSLFIFNENKGFIGGSGCFNGEQIEQFNSGVFTATTIDAPTWDNNNQVIDIDFYNNNFGLAASKSGLILRTNDGGLNWDTIPTVAWLDNIELTSVLIVNDTLCYAGYDNLDNPGSGQSLLVSMDAGLTWDLENNIATFFYPAFLSLHQSGNGNIYSGANYNSFPDGKEGLIFEKRGNSSWEFQMVSHPINSFSSYNDSIIFAVGDSGYIVTNRNPQTKIYKPFFDGYKVQVFPNPAIDYIEVFVGNDFKKGIEIELEIYNALGQVFLKKKYSGTNPLVGLTAFPDGVYYLKISDGKGLIGIEKVVKSSR